MLYRLMSRRETIHHCGSTLRKPGPRKPRVQLGIDLNTAELVTVNRNQGQSICFFRGLCVRLSDTSLPCWTVGFPVLCTAFAANHVICVMSLIPGSESLSFESTACQQHRSRT